MHPDLSRFLEKYPVVASRDYPTIRRKLIRLAAAGDLVRLLPGVFTLPHRVDDLTTRAAAACRYDPAAVVVGDAAAALSYWKELHPEVILVAGAQRRIERPGYLFVRRHIPHGLISRRSGIRYSSPALTALDQVETHGSEGIDRALRSRRTTVAQLRDVLEKMPKRRGNTDRRAAVLDSRDGGWSALERAMHRLLREAGIGGWSANVWVETEIGDYVVDIAFHHSPLCIELDGQEFHGAAKFDEDRLRGDELLLAGRQVLRFTWTMVDKYPDMVIAMVRRALRLFGPVSSPGVGV